MCFSWPVHRLGPLNHVGLTLPVVNIHMYAYQCTWGWPYLIHVNGCRAGCWTWWTYLVRAEGFESCMRGLCMEKTWLSPSSQHSSSEDLPASYLCLVSVPRLTCVSVPDWPVSLYQTDPCLCTRLTLVSAPRLTLVPVPRLTLVSVPDRPLSLYQTDPCLCTRLTLVSVPDWPLSLCQTDPCLCARLTLVSVPEMLLCWFSVLVAGIVTYLDANRTVQVKRRYACPYTTVFKSIYVVDYGNTAVLIESIGKTVGSLILQVFVPSFKF